MEKLLPALILVICLTVAECKSSTKTEGVELVDRRAVFAFDTQPNPLTLVIDIKEGGKLSLNKINTGTISDPAELSEKLKAIFDDRKKAGIDKTEVVIDPHGKISREDLDTLIERVANAKASPIRLIKDDL